MTPDDLGTLILIKPDGVRRRMVGQIVSAIESLGLHILYLQLRCLTSQEAQDLYQEHKNKWHFKRNIKHITSNFCTIIWVNGKNQTVEMCRTMVTNFREANQDVIRLPANLVHATSSLERVEHELRSVNIEIPELTPV